MSDARLKCSTNSASIALIFSFVATEVSGLSCFCSVATGTRAAESRAHIHTCVASIRDKHRPIVSALLCCFLCFSIGSRCTGIAFERRTNEMPHICTFACVTYSNLVGTRHAHRARSFSCDGIRLEIFRWSSVAFGWNRGRCAEKHTSVAVAVSA